MPHIEVKGADGLVLGTYHIIADSYGGLIKDEDLFEHARRNVVEDGLVSENDSLGLSFKVVD